MFVCTSLRYARKFWFALALVALPAAAQTGLGVVRGTVQDLIEIASRTVLDTIVIALPAGTEKRLGEIVGQLRKLSAEIVVLPGTAPPRYLESPVCRVGTLSAIEILARPVNDRRVKAKGSLVRVIERAPEFKEPVDPEVGLTLGVCAVQLDVAQGSLSLGASFL